MKLFFYPPELKQEQEARAQGGEWEPVAKKRRSSSEEEAPKKQALRATLAMQLSHHSMKVTVGINTAQLVGLEKIVIDK